MPDTLGVTVGKFNPPHLGHSHLIASAAQQCDRLVVVVADRPDQTLRAYQRAAWLKEAHPTVDFLCTPDDLPEEPEPWAQRVVGLVGRVPDVAFTSEDYGTPWANAMGCRHVPIDLERSQHSISGTMTRNDLSKHFTHLIPPARRDLSLNVVVVGCESSGTTTLATALAHHLGTVMVPEYGRDYWVQRTADRPKEPWATEDFLHIATEHHRGGSLLAEQSTGVTIWDTDALATTVWHRHYLNIDSTELNGIATAHTPDLYVLTAPDFPFVQDGTRLDGPHRAAMHQWFRESLEASGAPWIEVTGPHSRRLDQTVKLVGELEWPVLT